MRLTDVMLVITLITLSASSNALGATLEFKQPIPPDTSLDGVHSDAASHRDLERSLPFHPDDEARGVSSSTRKLAVDPKILDKWVHNLKVYRNIYRNVDERSKVFGIWHASIYPSMIYRMELQLQLVLRRSQSTSTSLSNTKSICLKSQM